MTVRDNRSTRVWRDTIQSTFATEKIYVVQTYTKVVQRCLLMTTDPGDLVLDPTCGSGAFLFAALNILEPLYDACLVRMEAFLDDLKRSAE